MRRKLLRKKHSARKRAILADRDHTRLSKDVDNGTSMLEVQRMMRAEFRRCKLLHKSKSKGPFGTVSVLRVYYVKRTDIVGVTTNDKHAMLLPSDTAIGELSGEEVYQLVRKKARRTGH